MLTMVGAGATGKSTKDWHEVWMNSEQAKDVQRELEHIKQEMGTKQANENEGTHTEFAMPFTNQSCELCEVNITSMMSTSREIVVLIVVFAGSQGVTCHRLCE